MGTHRNCLVEYNKDGSPTGICWVDGRRHTGYSGPSLDGVSAAAKFTGYVTLIEPDQNTAGKSFTDHSAPRTFQLHHKGTQQAQTLTPA